MTSLLELFFLEKLLLVPQTEATSRCAFNCFHREETVRNHPQIIPPMESARLRKPLRDVPLRQLHIHPQTANPPEFSDERKYAH